MTVVVVERTAPGQWRVGTRSAPEADITWVGSARAAADRLGVDYAGPWSIDPTVRLLIAGEPDADHLEHDTDPFRIPKEARRQAGPATTWERATAGNAKVAGRTLADMARSGRMGAR